MNPMFVFVAGARITGGTWVTARGDTRDSAMMILLEQYAFCRFTDLQVTKYRSVDAERCGECENCKRLEQVKQRVLACIDPPFSHADDGVVAVWNDELIRLPCIGDQHGE